MNAVVLIIDAWTSLGGTLWIGRGNESSCFLDGPRTPRSTRPYGQSSFYPTGKCEVVFQHLAVRPPFDDIELRREFLTA